MAPKVPSDPAVEEKLWGLYAAKCVHAWMHGEQGHKSVVVSGFCSQTHTAEQHQSKLLLCEQTSPLYFVSLAAEAKGLVLRGFAGCCGRLGGRGARRLERKRLD